MILILGFSPFILFAVLSRLSADLALWAAFAAAFVVTIRDFVESPSLRLLDVGNLTLFAALALVRGFLAPSLGLIMLRFIAETFLFLLLAGSLASRRPLSLQYVQAPPREPAVQPIAAWPAPLFARVNYVISGVWAAAFAAMAATDGAIAFNPILPLYPAIAVSVAALAVAITFTLRYPGYAVKQAGA